jgi:hypothetical protein
VFSAGEKLSINVPFAVFSAGEKLSINVPSAYALQVVPS